MRRTEWLAGWGGGGPGAVVVLETECVLKKREEERRLQSSRRGDIQDILELDRRTYLADKLNAGGRLLCEVLHYFSHIRSGLRNVEFQLVGMSNAVSFSAPLV